MPSDLPWEPYYSPNNANGTDVRNGNGELKGFTVKWATREAFAAAIPRVHDSTVELDTEYPTDQDAITAILRWHIDNGS